MDVFWTAAMDGLVHLFTWPTVGYMFLGIGMGFIIGLIPGLSGVTGMALLLPFVFDKSPYEAFAMLMGMYAVTTVSDTIPAVMLGVPGTAAAQAHILDGYPMAKKGEAARALGASYMADIMSTLLGVAVFALLYPVLTTLIRIFGAPEYFMLGILALSMVGYVGGGATPLRGLIVAGLGLMISMVGLAPLAGFPRYTFGLLYLWELPLVPIVLGLFAVPELINLIIGQQSISRGGELKPGSGMLRGITDALQQKALILRTGLVGAICGLIPAMGGAVVDWWGYGVTVQTSKDKSQFGKGDVRGIIGPQSAVAAQKPAALIPTLAFGIPGNTPMALMLGAFLILGLRPGAEMLTKHLDVTMLMMWAIVVSNVIACLMAMAMAAPLARLTLVRSSILAPVVLAFIVVGATAGDGAIGHVVLMFGFGGVGYIMHRTGWPRAPMVLGLILGPIIETWLFIAMQRYDWAWVGRPTVIILALIIASTFLMPKLVDALGQRFTKGEVDDVRREAQ